MWAKLKMRSRHPSPSARLLTSIWRKLIRYIYTYVSDMNVYRDCNWVLLYYREKKVTRELQRLLWKCLTMIFFCAIISQQTIGLASRDTLRARAKGRARGRARGRRRGRGRGSERESERTRMRPRTRKPRRKRGRGSWGRGSGGRGRWPWIIEHQWAIRSRW